MSQGNTTTSRWPAPRVGSQMTQFFGRVGGAYRNNRRAQSQSRPRTASSVSHDLDRRGRSPGGWGVPHDNDEIAVEDHDAPYGNLSNGFSRLDLSRPDLIQQQTTHSNPKRSPYNKDISTLRKEEYAHMSSGVYLDHSGATIYAKSLIDRFSNKLATSLLGNPHSANAPAMLSGDVVDSVREKTLRFLGADPRHYDLIFVANATAAIKMVADTFRDLSERSIRQNSFWYGYHRDAHTSLVGVREFTNGDHHCFGSDAEVERWLDSPYDADSGVGRTNIASLGLFAYPGQSNLNGRRLPLSWPRRLRESVVLQNTYSLLDCAALAMTCPMERVFADPDAAPDFACFSFYKIFGFPDLGGLVVRKASGHILTLRKYFGGGTVTMVSAVGAAWHKSKGQDIAQYDGGDGSAANGHGNGHGHGSYSIHDALEDGTLPFHSILALGEAIDVHRELYGSMENISRYTTELSAFMYNAMVGLRYANGQPLVQMYNESNDSYGDSLRQGATFAFNVFRADGMYVSYEEVERMANEFAIYIRSGGICCPGGLFSVLQYEPWELDRAKSAGHLCGGAGGTGIIHSLPTGVVRASLGAMTTIQEVYEFLNFLRKAFLEREEMMYPRASSKKPQPVSTPRTPTRSPPTPPLSVDFHKPIPQRMARAPIVSPLVCLPPDVPSN